jgi:hypothetical protein
MLSEVVLAAASEASFSYLLERSGLADRAVKWLSKDPRHLAFQIALTRAYTTFARTYPQWAAACFDEQFLRGTAGPLLARCLERENPLLPADLAAAWLDQMGWPEERRALRSPELIKVAAEFLRWLEAELRARAEFQSFFDSRALDSIADATSQIEHALDALQVQFTNALAQAGKYQLTIEKAQGLVIGDNASVSNVFQTFFAGDYVSLQDFYLPPDPVFERVTLDDFVGRAWLETELDRFLAEHDRGVWLFTGEAGVGKTSFQAHLVRERGYLHFFAEQAPGNANLPRALQSLAAQLITRYHLDPYATRDTLPLSLSTYPDFLERLIFSAAATLGAGERLVLVLDAVDEAGSPIGQNVLGLPRRLPPCTYLVISQRPQPVKLDIDPVPYRIDLLAADANNLADISAFLDHMATRKPLSDLLAQNHVIAADFTHTLADKSDGNWMYMCSVVAEICNGQRNVDDLATLPKGLVVYYAQYWNRWRDGDNWDKWDTLYAPLLATLAGAMEPVPLSYLKTWAGVQASDYTLRHLLREEWHAFTLELDSERYRPRHASLQEFFSGEAHGEVYAPDVEGLLDELRDRARMAHRRIVAELRTICNGKWSQLTAREDPADRDPFSLARHVRTFLSAHLALAGEPDDQNELFQLVDDAEWYRTQTVTDPTGSTYLTDISRAWAAARWEDAECAQRGYAPTCLGREVRCVLEEVSLRKRLNSIPAAVLSALAILGIWPARQVLAVAGASGRDEDAAQVVATLIDRSLAQQMPALQKSALLDEALVGIMPIESASAKVAALLVLVPLLSEQQHIQIMQELENLSERIPDAATKAHALIQLAPHLAEPKLHDALMAARTTALALTDVNNKARMLAGLAGQLPEHEKEEVMHEALDALQTATDGSDPEDLENLEVDALIALIPQLSGLEQDRAVQLALHIARETNPTENTENDDGDLEAVAVKLAQVAEVLPEPQKREVLQEALIVARKIANPMMRPSTIARLVPAMSGLDQTTALEEAIADGRSSNDSATIAMVLGYLATSIPESHRSNIVLEAFEAARQVSDIGLRHVLLAHLVPQLPKQQQAIVREDLQEPGAIEATGKHETDGTDRVKLLVVLSQHLDEPDGSFVAQEALAIARSIPAKFPYDRSCALLAVMPCLSEEERAATVGEILATDRSSLPHAEQADVLAGLIAYLTEPLRTEVLDQALTMARDIDEVQFEIYGQFEQLWVGEFRAILGRMVDSPGKKSQPLATIAALVGEPERSAILQEALASVYQISDHQRQAKALVALAPLLSEADVRAAWDDIQPGQTSEWQQQMLLALVRRLCDLGPAEGALRAARALWRDAVPAEVAALLERATTEPGAEPATEDTPSSDEAHSDAGSANRSGTFTATIPYDLTGLGRMLRNSLVPQIELEAGENISEQEKEEIERDVERALAEQLVETLGESEINEQFAKVSEFRYGLTWMQCRGALLARLAELGSAADALTIARLAWDRVPVTVLAAIVPYLQGPERAVVLGEIVAASQELPAMELLETLAPLVFRLALPEQAGVMLRVLTAAQDIATPHPLGEQVGRLEASTVSTLVPLLPVAVAVSVLQQALRQRVDEERRDLLTHLQALVPALDALGGAGLCKEVADAILVVGARWS